MNNEPKEVWGAGTPWKTRSEFYVWLRGLLRRGWSKHPLKVNKMRDARFKVDKVFKNGKIAKVWHCKCELCSKTGPQKEFEVDHIVPAGSLRCFQDIEGFIKRLLFVKEDDLRILCKECNATLAYSEKNGVTFEEAKATKTAIRLVASKQDKIWLEERGISAGTNQAVRRKQIIDELSKELISGKVILPLQPNE